MGIRATIATAFGAKASVIGLPPGDQPDRPLEKTWDDYTLLTTYGDDPWPYICATKVAEQGSLPPLQIGTEASDGTFTPLPPTSGVQQLFDRPNPLNTGGEFRQLLLLYMELAGHAPIEIVRPSKGARLNGRERTGFEIYAHNPGPWRIVANSDGTIRGYLYLLSNTPWAGQQAGMVNASDIRWDSTEMTYLRWPNPVNRWYGQGRLAAVRQQIMAEEYAGIRDKRFEQQMGVPPGILTSEMPLGAPQADELQRRWEKAVGGYTNAGRIAVLGAKTTYQSIAQPNTAGDHQTREDRIDAICGAFGIPRILVVMGGGTFSNAKEARSEFWEGTLHPRLLRIQEMVTERLLPLIVGDDRYVAKFDFSHIDALNENQAEVADRAVKWVQTASTKKVEVRELIGLPPFNDARDEELALPTMFRDTLAAASFDSADPATQAQAAAPATPAGPTPPKPPAKALTKRREPRSREELLAPARDAYKSQLATFFESQRGALIGTRKFTKALPEDDGQSLIDRAIAIINSVRFRDRLQRISEPAVKMAFQLGAEDAAAAMGVNVTFSIGASPEALRAVNARLVGLSQALQSTTTDDVTRVISDGLAAGDDIEQIRSDLGALFDGYEQWRLDRISRTETTNAYNIGSVGQYRDAGVSQVYVTDGDGDDPCEEADGSVWSLEEAESDPSAHPNCTRSFDPIPPDEAPTPSDTIDEGDTVTEAAPRPKRTKFEYDAEGRLAGWVEQ